MNSSHGALHTAGLRHTCDSPRLGELFGPRGVWTCRSLGTWVALLCLVLQRKTSLLWAPDLVPARSAECRPKARKAERPFGSGGPVTVSPRLCFAVFALVGIGGGTKGVAWTAVRSHPTLSLTSLPNRVSGCIRAVSVRGTFQHVSGAIWAPQGRAPKLITLVSSLQPRGCWVLLGSSDKCHKDPCPIWKGKSHVPRPEIAPLSPVKRVLSPGSGNPAAEGRGAAPRSSGRHRRSVPAPPSRAVGSGLPRQAVRAGDRQPDRP